jgi:hypothetical protein
VDIEISMAVDALFFQQSVAGVLRAEVKLDLD